MKKRITAVAVMAFMAFALLFSCQTNSKKIENAQENVAKANAELFQALKDSIQEYRSVTQVKLIENEKRLAEYKIKIANEKKANKAKYEAELAKLEKKNNDLKLKLENYNEEGDEKWEAFKAEFNSDMENLGKSFKDLTVKNVK